MSSRLVLTIGLMCVSAAVTPAAAQGIPPVPSLATAVDIDRVRSLYDAAAYEEALAAMPAINGEPARTDLEQYRALCLLALGRDQEAMAAVERLVRDNPLFLPSADDTSPRMQAMFASARFRLVPDIARAAYGEARRAYQSKNREAAHSAFLRALELMDSLPEAEKASLADLRLLAGEFLKLSTPPASPAHENGESAPKDAKIEPPPTFVGPLAVREQLPAWIPPDSAARQTEYTGLIRLLIDAEGRVTSATVVRASHPAYDALVVSAATRWVYKPATRGGQPVVSTKELQVRLVPQ